MHLFRHNTGIDGQTDGRTDRHSVLTYSSCTGHGVVTDRQTDGRTDGQTDRNGNIMSCSAHYAC